MATFDPTVASSEPPTTQAETAGTSSDRRREYKTRELEDVRALIPATMIQAANSSFVQVVVM